MSDKKKKIYLEIDLHKKFATEGIADMIRSLFKGFINVADIKMVDIVDGKVTYSITFKHTECKYETIILWALIGFFADYWKDIDKVVAIVEGKTTKIFPVDSSMGG